MINADVCEHCGSLACLIANAVECRHTGTLRSQAPAPPVSVQPAEPAEPRKRTTTKAKV